MVASSSAGDGKNAVEELAKEFSQKATTGEKGRQTEGEEDETHDSEEGEHTTIVGSCKCGSCRFEFSLKQVLHRGHTGKLDMVNCHCERCRRAHAAAFATYVIVRTAGLQNLQGSDVIRVRADRCSGLEGDVLRAFCGKCFASMATFQKFGHSVQVSAGCLAVDSLPAVADFVAWCKELAPPYLGFVPSKKEQKELRGCAGRSKVTGGCACGSCRFSIKRLPEELQHCYCGSCRLLSGAAWQTWMPVEDSHMSWISKDGLKLVRTTSHARRHVCTKCGVFMTIVYDEDGAVWPLAGAMDDKCYREEDLYARVSNVSHICVKYKQPWWTLPRDGLQRIKEACGAESVSRCTGNLFK